MSIQKLIYAIAYITCDYTKSTGQIIFISRVSGAVYTLPAFERRDFGMGGKKLTQPIRPYSSPLDVIVHKFALKCN